MAGYQRPCNGQDRFQTFKYWLPFWALSTFFGKVLVRELLKNITVKDPGITLNVDVGYNYLQGRESGHQQLGDKGVLHDGDVQSQILDSRRPYTNHTDRVDLKCSRLMIEGQPMNSRIDCGTREYGGDNRMTEELVDFERNKFCRKKKIESFKE